MRSRETYVTEGGRYELPSGAKVDAMELIRGGEQVMCKYVGPGGMGRPWVTLRIDFLRKFALRVQE